MKAHLVAIGWREYPASGPTGWDVFVPRAGARAWLARQLWWML